MLVVGLETFNQLKVLGLFPFYFQKLALHLKMCLHSLAFPPSLNSILGINCSFSNYCKTILDFSM
jgi:hypothetical protein